MSYRAVVQQSLEKYVTSSRAFPLVLILSDAYSDKKDDSIVTIRQICSQQLLDCAHQIVFNPIAKTILKKAITNIINKDSKRMKKLNLSANQIELIAESSSGDVLIN